MAWGAKGASGVADLVSRLASNDSRLKELHVLRMRKLDDVSYKALFGALTANTVCKTLYTSGHPISPVAAGYLADMLSRNKTITLLCVGDSTFATTGLESLAKGLAANATVDTLDLENKGMTPELLDGLLQQLQQNASLRTLLMPKNTLGVSGLACLSRLPTNITHLNVHSCDLQLVAPSDQGAAPALPAALTSLDLSRNSLGPLDAPLATLLTSCTALRSLELSQSAIGDAGAAALGSLFSQKTTLCVLRHMDISGCNIGSEGVAELAAGLKASNPSAALEELLIGGNPVAEQGVLALVDGLKPLSKLSQLDLSEAGVTVDCLAALDTLTQLQSLVLLGNKLTDVALPRLADLVDGGKKEAGRSGGGLRGLLSLCLSGNGLTVEAMATFLGCVERCASESHTRVMWEELQLGANPCCEGETFGEVVTSLREALPALTVVWRATDLPQQPGGGVLPAQAASTVGL